MEQYVTKRVLSFFPLICQPKREQLLAYIVWGVKNIQYIVEKGRRANLLN